MVITRGGYKSYMVQLSIYYKKGDNMVRVDGYNMYIEISFNIHTFAISNDNDL
jgi:hypothetical protein